MRIRVATRGSKLSLAQTRIALEYVKKAIPEAEFEIITVKTKGDVHQDKPLYKIGGKGLFEKEVNKAILDGRADIAVHSMKDLPSEIDPRLEIALIPPRDSPHDVLISRKGTLDPFNLPNGMVIGTSSMRRKALVLHYNPNVRVEPIRGNVDTRLRKLDQGLYDAIILAEAGLLRLGINREYVRLPIDRFTPAPGQGLLAVVAPSGSQLASRLSRASDPRASREAAAERAFLEAARGGCHIPLGGVAVHVASRMVFHAVIASSDGSNVVGIRLRGDPERAAELGRRAGEIVNSLIDRVLEG